MVIVSGQPREPYANGATLALSGARTVWATKVGIVLKNRASLVLLRYRCVKFVRFFLRHWYPPSKWKLEKRLFSPFERGKNGGRVRKSPVFKGKTAILSIFILRVGASGGGKYSQTGVSGKNGKWGRCIVGSHATPVASYSLMEIFWALLLHWPV